MCAQYFHSRKNGGHSGTEVLKTKKYKIVLGVILTLEKSYITIKSLFNKCTITTLAASFHMINVLKIHNNFSLLWNKFGIAILRL